METNPILQLQAYRIAGVQTEDRLNVEGSRLRDSQDRELKLRHIKQRP